MGQKTRLWEGAARGAGKQQTAARSDAAQAAGERLRRQQRKAAGEMMLQRRHPALPRGRQLPRGSVLLSPAFPCSHLLPPPCQPSALLRLATTAKPQRCALAFPTAQPQRDSSGAGIRRGTAPTQTHRPRARRLLRARRCHVAHPPNHPPPESKFEALAHFPLQACCMSKQICLQTVRLSVCLPAPRCEGAHRTVIPTRQGCNRDQVK